MGRGYFGIGIYHSKFGVNLGTLWRSAYQLGADFIFTIGARYEPEASDTPKTWKHIPLWRFAEWRDFREHLPMAARLVGVEMGGVPVGVFSHPERAVYLLGSEDQGLPDAIRAECHSIVSLPAVRRESYNVAVAGALVMYDRLAKSPNAIGAARIDSSPEGRGSPHETEGEDE